MKSNESARFSQSRGRQLEMDGCEQTRDKSMPISPVFKKKTHTHKFCLGFGVRAEAACPHKHFYKIWLHCFSRLMYLMRLGYLQLSVIL